MTIKVFLYPPNGNIGATTPIELTDIVTTKFNVLDWDGLGMAPVKNILATGPMQQGSTRVGYKLQPRIISLAVDAIATSEATLFSQRSALLEAVALSESPLILAIQWAPAGGGTATRYIDCWYNGQMTMASKNKSGYHQKTIMELIAPNPIWFSSEIIGPHLHGVAEIAAGAVITYTGTYEVHPPGYLTGNEYILLYGPIEDPVITVTHADGTHEKLDFTGVHIAGGGGLRKIDCRYGYRTVVDETGADKIADLTDDSDLSTFCLKKTIDTGTYQLSGINTITITGGGTNANSIVNIYYHNCWIGI